MAHNNMSAELMIGETLQAATNSNHDIVKKAELQLQEWEHQIGFFPILANFSTNLEININVRWMAAVYLKNSITKYWRRGTRQGLQAEEKTQIRKILLMHCAEEPVPQVSLQLAVTIAQIARIDCPRDWPQLLPHLLERLEHTSKNNDLPAQHRILIVLHHVIKALASRRCLADKRIFQELASNIFVFIQNLWNNFTVTFFEQLEKLSSSTSKTLESALITLRILRKLINYGFAKPHNYDYCMKFIDQVINYLHRCLKCRYDLKEKYANEEDIIGLLEKFILKQIKTICEFQELHNLAFAHFVPTILDFCFNYVFHDGAHLIFTNNVTNFRNFTIHCINIMKAIMLCNAYNIPSVQTTTTQTATAKEVITVDNKDMCDILNDFFSQERITHICEKIICYYFLLTQMELDNWYEDPEGFAQDDAGECWKFSLTPCVETLYSTLFSKYTTPMVTEVLKFVHKSENIQLTSNCNLNDILLKDSIYKAVGLASFHFFNDIDFNNWFSGQLLQELRLPEDQFRILRRRIIWLVGEFAAVKFSRELRPLAYEACLHLLNRQHDMTVRLAASRTLSTLVCDYEFTHEHFLPYLHMEFNALFDLLQDAKECDTKMNVLTVMSALVETLSEYMERELENLISYLPLLWKESENFNMLRCAILCILQQLVKALRDIPNNLRCFLYNVIDISTNVQTPLHIYLIEEGLSLWLCMLENSKHLNYQQLDLCKNLMPIIEMSSENLRCVLYIIQAYILLDAQVFLNSYGKAFIQCCDRLFMDLRSEGIMLILKVFETCIRTEPTASLAMLRSSLPLIFRQVYINKELPMLINMYITIIARVVLIDQKLFNEIIHDLNDACALETILDVWLEKTNLVTENDKRKLFCLALVSLIGRSELISERFSKLACHIARSLEEVMYPEEDDTSNQVVSQKTNISMLYYDSLVFVDEIDLDTSNFCTMDDFDYKTYHYDRLRKLALKDPVHKIKLDQYVKWALTTLETQIGNESFKKLIASVNANSLDILKKHNCV